MNREIKFRVWKEEDQEYFYFDLSKNPEYWVEELKDDKCEQYIGLKDKNNIEIYEGDNLIDRCPIDDEDISKGYDESMLKVVWDDKKLMWCLDVSFKQDGSFLTSLVDYFGVGDHLEIKY